MDPEAEATVARVYYNFQNRKFPMIKPKVIPKQKNNIIKTKDGIVVLRPKGYNYMDKNYIPNDKIKLPVIPRNDEIIDKPVIHEYEIYRYIRRRDKPVIHGYEIYPYIADNEEIDLMVKEYYKMLYEAKIKGHTIVTGRKTRPGFS